MQSRHPARTIPFDRLVEGLELARDAGLVHRSRDAATGRELWTYSSRCIFETGWNEFTLLARGLILHPSERRVVATPFPKFFNVGEGGRTIPDLPFETYEKLDGSLAIIHHHDGRWRAATKGAFDSAQSAWTEARLAAQDVAPLVPGKTYLAEAVYPENRIIVRYDEPALVLLAAYHEDGQEMEFDELAETADGLGWRVAQRHAYPDAATLLADAAALPRSAEGFVLRFVDGQRMKVKGAAYLRIHALIVRCTPLGLWEALAAGEDTSAIRRELPEEFWSDFDTMLDLLQRNADALAARIAAAAASVASLSDKEVAQSLDTLPAEVRPFIFTWRKQKGALEGRVRQVFFRQLRPTGNVLAGYVPSYALRRLQQESG